MLKITFVTQAKINCIKAVRTVTGMGLKDAKDMVEQGGVLRGEQMHYFLQRVKQEFDATNPSFGLKFEVEPYIRVPAPVEVPDSQTWGRDSDPF